jgi:hypothetical protein
MIDFKEFKDIMYCFPEETPGEEAADLNGRRSVRRLSQRRVTLRRSTLGYENYPISID